MACEDFKKTKSAAKMAEKAKKIYEEFIQAEAPKEVGPEGLPQQHPRKGSHLGNVGSPRPSDWAWPPFLSTYWVQGQSSWELILPGRAEQLDSLSSSSNDTRVWP